MMWCCDGHLSKSAVQHKTSTEVANERGEAGEVAERRYLEKLIGGPIAGTVINKTAAVLGCFGVLFIPCIYLVFQIEPAQRAEQGLPEDHPFQRIFTSLGEEFPSSAEQSTHYMNTIWGVKGMDREGVDLLRDGDFIGELEWDTTFKFDEAAQEHILAVCDEVSTYERPDLQKMFSPMTGETIPTADIQCWLQDWKAFRDSRGQGWPVPYSNLVEELREFTTANTSGQWGMNITYEEKFGDMLGTDGDGMVQMIQIKIKSRLSEKTDHGHDKMETNYNAMNDWIDDINGDRFDAPETANKAFQTIDGDFNGPLWMWMNTQKIYARSAITGVIAGACLAFLVIMAGTGQIIVAFFALISILGILLCVLGMMVLNGDKLGSLTSICITILCGFAVDYVVHLAHSYVTSPKANRKDKVQEAMDEIGVSVFSGMMTSVLASIALFLCILQFFSKFGFFLMCTVIWSWVWANFFFCACMALVGPDDTTPEWMQFPSNVFCKSRVRKPKVLGEGEEKDASNGGPVAPFKPKADPAADAQ